MLVEMSKVLRIVLLLGLVAGCSTGDQFADIRQFMADIETKPRGTIAPLPEFEAYQAFTYGAANQRSPFEPPIIVPPKTAEQKRNIGVKPPKNHVKQYLERFPLSALAMVGTLQKDNSTFALIEDSNGEFTGSQSVTTWAINGDRSKVLKTPASTSLRLSLMAQAVG